MSAGGWICFNEAAAKFAAEVALPQAAVPAGQAAGGASGRPASRQGGHPMRAARSTMSNSGLTRKRFPRCERSPPTARDRSARAAAAEIESRRRDKDHHITMAARFTLANEVLPRLSTRGSTLSARPRSRIKT
jgi:hypothetical protein